MNHVDVAHFGPRPDQIGLARPAAFGDAPQGGDVIVDVEPVAHVRALAVNRQRLADHGVEHGQRDQLFGKLIGTVIVRAVRHQHRQPVGAKPGAGEMVGAGLARRIGRARAVAAVVVETSGRAELAIDLVGGHLQKTESAAAGGVEAAPIIERRFEQRRRADDIGLDKGGGASIERSTWLSAARWYSVGAVLAEQRRHRGAIADVGANKYVVGFVADRRQIVEISGIGQLVDGDDALAVGDQRAHQGRADKAGAAGDDHRHALSSTRSGCGAGRRRLRPAPGMAIGAISDRLPHLPGHGRARPGHPRGCPARPGMTKRVCCKFHRLRLITALGRRQAAPLPPACCRSRRAANRGRRRR